MHTVRRAEEKDIPAILDLLLQVNMVHHRGRPDLFKGPTTKYSAEELVGILKNENTPVFVCTDESGRILGHGFCVREHQGGRLMEENDSLYIDDICVDGGARRQGVGKALYGHIRAWAKSKGCRRINLNVWTCNPGAKAFYESLGMKEFKVGMEEVLE